MAKYKYGEDVYLLATGSKTRIKSVITNYSRKHTSYILDNGMSVCEGSIVKEMPIKIEKRGRKKKEVIEPIEEVKEDLKVDNNEQTDIVE